MYYDIMNKLEANVDGNWHFGPEWSAGLLTHFENGFSSHDANSDGFADMPQVRQLALMPRVAYLGRSYVFQAPDVTSTNAVQAVSSKAMHIRPATCPCTGYSSTHAAGRHLPRMPLCTTATTTAMWH